MLADAGIERAVLAAMLRYGNEAYIEVADFLNPDSFTIDSNQVLFKCVRDILEKDDGASIDVPSILNAAKVLGIDELYTRHNEINHLKSIFDFPVNSDNVRKFGAKIRKLQIARMLSDKLDECKYAIENLTGEETFAAILGIPENALFDFSSLINDRNEPKPIGKGLRERINYLAANPVTQVGLSTGLPRYDKAVGGGLRNSGVAVIVARMKTGKTMLGETIGLNIALNNDVPVLYLDTEMECDEHESRGIAMLSEVPIDDIENGMFAENPDKFTRVHKAIDRLEHAKYSHYPIGLIPIEEQLSIARRWLSKEVGFNSDKTAKPCCIIYDYIKLTSADGISKNLQEYQAIGFLMTTLHNFARRYKIPILAFCQTNRDGIDKETTAVAAGSDRIGWLSSSLTIFKEKSDEEIAQDGVKAGNRKLVPLVTRYGQGLPRNQKYISVQFKGWCGKIYETDDVIADPDNPGFIVDDAVNSTPL